MHAKHLEVNIASDYRLCMRHDIISIKSLIAGWKFGRELEVVDSTVQGKARVLAKKLKELHLIT